MNLALAALVAAVLAVGGRSNAADVYRWTDERGVVHFSDVPPPQAGKFTTESLPDAPPRAAESEGNAAPVEGAAAAAPAAEQTSVGPASVVLKAHDAVAVGPATQAFRGKVKNQGGSAARDVTIAIVVTEPIQGAECLRDVIDVEPPTLRPGEEGSFDAQFDNPCFHGPTNADLRAEWR